MSACKFYLRLIWICIHSDDLVIGVLNANSAMVTNEMWILNTVIDLNSKDLPDAFDNGYSVNSNILMIPSWVILQEA